MIRESIPRYFHANYVVDMSRQFSTQWNMSFILQYIYNEVYIVVVLAFTNCNAIIVLHNTNASTYNYIFTPFFYVFNNVMSTFYKMFTLALTGTTI